MKIIFGLLVLVSSQSFAADNRYKFEIDFSGNCKCIASSSGGYFSCAEALSGCEDKYEPPSQSRGKPFKAVRNKK